MIYITGWSNPATSGTVDIDDISSGTQTNDVKITLDSEQVIINKGDTDYTKVWKYVALSGTGETTIWDPTGGKKFALTDIMVSATAAGTCTLRDHTAGSVIWIASLAQNGGFVSNFQTPIQSATADNILTAQASAATQYVLVAGYEV